MNFLACEWHAGAAQVGGIGLESSSAIAPGAHESLCLGIRPEYVQLRESPGANCLPARVVRVRDEGIRAMAELEITGHSIWARLRAGPRLPAIGPAFAHFPAERCALYADGRRVA